MEAGTTLVNGGTIAGGAGGSAVVGGHGGNGGEGVVSIGNGMVTNAGSISGGLAGDGRTRADAVDFSGGGNTLTLENGYSFVGNVISNVSTHGGDTLALGGSTNDTFDLAQIVTTQPSSWSGTVQYYGFTGLAKTGSSTWVVSGSTTSTAPWTISAGTLALSGTGSIADATDVNVAAGATFDISNATQGASIVSLDGVGSTYANNYAPPPAP